LSFRDRLKSCSYISPSGKGFALLCDELERSGTKRLASHERPSLDGALFQDMGQSPTEYPLSCYIAGPDYDLAADAFAAALPEKGKGTLEHPRWGTLVVYPVTFSQTENFVDGERLANFSIKFIHAPTSSPIFSTATTAAAILSGAQKASESNVATWTTKKAAELAKLKKTIKKTAAEWTAKLQAIKDLPASVRTEINAAGTFIERSIDTIVQTPLDLCASLTAFARIPSQAETVITAKLESYGLLITDTIDRLVSEFTPTEPASYVSSSTVSLVALQIAAIEAAVSGLLSSRDDAVFAHALASNQYAEILAALEALTASGHYPDADLMAQIAALQAALAAYLLDAAFSLRVERRITLTADRNPLELLRELYGEIDDPDATLDEFIARNHLGADSLLVISRGTEIRYLA